MACSSAVSASFMRSTIAACSGRRSLVISTRQVSATALTAASCIPTASVPIAAAMILEAGVSPGAALVFLMTGPATNAATITTVWKVLGRRTATVYLLTIAATALAAGLALDYIFTIQGIPPVKAARWMLPNWVKWASAVVLLGVLGFALFRRAGSDDTTGRADADQESCHDD